MEEKAASLRPTCTCKFPHLPKILIKFIINKNNDDNDDGDDDDDNDDVHEINGDDEYIG